MGVFMDTVRVKQIVTVFTAKKHLSPLIFKTGFVLKEAL